MNNTCSKGGRTAMFAAVLGAVACASPLRAGASEPPMYTMVELGHIAPNSISVIRAISDPSPQGPVLVGESFNGIFSPPTLSWRAVAWRPDVSSIPIDLRPQAGASTVNRAQGVSPSGAFIVGYSNASPSFGMRWTFDPVGGAVTSTESLQALPGDLASEGVGVNSAGRAAGYSLTDSSVTRGATWAPGSTVATLLPSPSGSGGFRLARRISEPPTEHIVGRCDMGSTPTTRAIIWKKSETSYGTGQLLELLSPTQVHDAVGISPDGSIAVGLGAVGATSVGVQWDTTTNEASVAGSTCCSLHVAHAVNDDGVAVGYVGIAFEVFRATLFWNGEAFDLNDRIVGNPSIGSTEFLHFATGINSTGQIVGVFGGFASGDPVTPGRVFLLTPVVVLPADLDGDGAVNAADVGLLLGAWGGARADLNGDGMTDAVDLGLLLGAWTD